MPKLNSQISSWSNCVCTRSASKDNIFIFRPSSCRCTLVEGTDSKLIELRLTRNNPMLTNRMFLNMSGGFLSSVAQSQSNKCSPSRVCRWDRQHLINLYKLKSSFLQGRRVLTREREIHHHPARRPCLTEACNSSLTTRHCTSSLTYQRNQRDR